MKNKLIFCSLIILTIFACTKKSFIIDIEMLNANGKTVFLQRIIDNKTINIDSCLIENNKAVFNVDINDNNDAYHIFIKGWRRALPFFADNQNVIIKGDFNVYHKINVITDSKTHLSYEIFNKKYNEYNLNLDEINEKIKKAKNSNATDEVNSLDELYKKIENEQKVFIRNQICDNPSDVLSPFILYRYKWAFDLDELREITKKFSPELSTGYLGLVNDYIKMLERTEVGKPYLDFTLNNIEDKPITLSSIIGRHKIVMIDFWASWCPDCRVENPNIVSVYNDFHEKGLEIISVSLDTDKNAWIKGINDDGLYWDNHVSDLKGWNCAASTEYGVAFIPQNVLVNENGIIIAKNLNGDELRLFIEKYLE